MPGAHVTGNSTLDPSKTRAAAIFNAGEHLGPIEKRDSDQVKSLLAGVCGDPAAVLGEQPAPGPGSRLVRVFLPPARRVEVRPASGTRFTECERVHVEGVFEAELPGERGDEYVLRVTWESGHTGEVDDPYGFPPRLAVDDLAAFHAGTETRLHELLGANPEERAGVRGTRFAVWAPRALAVNVMGSFNGWEGRRNPMFPVGESGVWELFMPGVRPGDLYKFEVRAPTFDDPAAPDADTTDSPATRPEPSGPLAVEKADPLGRRMEVRPRTASVVSDAGGFEWGDAGWMSSRAEGVAPGRPISVYEVHPGSWRRKEDGGWLGYRELAAELLPYVRDLGFTHVELLPLTEHPHDASWGYQTVGYFALTSRYGDIDGFRHFVDEAHRLGIGVLLDWAPAHFPMDGHGLWRFDGQALYEHPDPQRGHHPDWGTAIFDYGRPEVVSFLVSSARYWLEEFHIDGLRVDAVASMLYLDYSRAEGEWEPNEEGGRENLEAVAFLQRLNEALHEACPGVLLCAEESTAWPGVTRAVSEGGLGFDLKWNMGWMNDTLDVLSAEPRRRPGLHERLTFSLHYAHAERYLLPLSHDEVVHLKGSLYSKMPGTDEEKLAGLRLLLGYQWMHPGAKLLFMGGELGQREEWNDQASLTWELLDDPGRVGLSAWVRALNEAYRGLEALHALDHSTDGFDWVDVHDARRSVLAFLRWAPGWADFVTVVANFSARMWSGYRAALPFVGDYEILLDSDAEAVGGAGRTRLASDAESVEHHGRPASIRIDLPPLTLVVLGRKADHPAKS